MEGDCGIVMEDVCGNDMWNLGERLVLMLMRTGILVGGVISANKKIDWCFKKLYKQYTK